MELEIYFHQIVFKFFFLLNLRFKGSRKKNLLIRSMRLDKNEKLKLFYY